MSNIYHNAKFLLSSPTLQGCPHDSGDEIIFCGYSNTGKSSVINALTLQKKLAKTSRTPGKTQHLTFFQLDLTRRLVDLPGYGYAQVSKHTKQKWRLNINEYFIKRKCLKAAILIIDCRRLLKDLDHMILDWCLDNDIKTHILLTKADKLTKIAANNQLLKATNQIKEKGPVNIQLFSVLKKQGLAELKAKLDSLFKLKTP